MASINKVILVGNLGRDPEVRYTPDNNAITNISVATTDRYKDKHSGEQKEITEWHRVVFFNRLAEIAGEYLKKGSQVYIEGRLRTRNLNRPIRRRKIHHRNHRRSNANARQPQWWQWWWRRLR